MERLIRARYSQYPVTGNRKETRRWEVARRERGGIK